MRFPSLAFLPVLIIGLFLLLPAGCVDKKGMVNPITTVENAGDINDNDIPYEIADAVMFSNYFMTGTDAFDDHATASISKSDVNGDGSLLDLADLVYLVRVITGDANPIQKPYPDSPLQLTLMGSTVSYDSPVDLGAVFLRFGVEGEIGPPILEAGAEAMDFKYHLDGDRLRILIYNIGTELIEVGDHDLVTITGDITLLGAKAATYDGYPIGSFVISNHAALFELGQNYPNPFSASTTISLSLPEASDWKITIRDDNGNFVIEFSGYAEAGRLDIVWDGTDAIGDPVEDGVYFYKATVGGQTITKSMILER